MTGWRDDVLDFWFGLEPATWWKGGPALDEEIKRRFHDLWRAERSVPEEACLGGSKDALAAVILFDQFPRNMFRGHADQFSTDPLALAIAAAAVDRGMDERLEPPGRGFLYMPFEHSETMEAQRRSLALFTALGDGELLRFARLHHDIIERFGRFPHRNTMLGRKPRSDEVAAGDVVPW